MSTKFNCCRIDQNNRELITSFIIKHWYDITMILRNELVDLSDTDGFCIIENGQVIGVITYRLIHDEAEITLLHTTIENCGIGTLLLEKLIRDSKSRNLRRIKVITTNDNINAISFYQKRGFDMICLYRDTMDYVRKIKPSVPLIGENNIPLRHEIEFGILLK